MYSFDFPKKGMQPVRNPGYQQQSGVHHQQTGDLYATGLNKNWCLEPTIIGMIQYNSINRKSATRGYWFLKFGYPQSHTYRRYAWPKAFIELVPQGPFRHPKMCIFFRGFLYPKSLKSLEHFRKPTVTWGTPHFNLIWDLWSHTAP